MKKQDPEGRARKVIKTIEAIAKIGMGLVSIYASYLIIKFCITLLMI